jgi:hypothetical protein
MISRLLSASSHLWMETTFHLPILQSQKYFRAGGSWLQAPWESRPFFQMKPCGHSPYVTSSLTRRCVAYSSSSYPPNKPLARTNVEELLSNNTSTVAAETCLPSASSSRLFLLIIIYWPAANTIELFVSLSLPRNGYIRHNTGVRLVLDTPQTWFRRDGITVAPRMKLQLPRHFMIQLLPRLHK